jgi:hypothetical protein
MRKLIILASTAVMVLWAAASFATPFSITYTADNALTDFTFSVDGGAAAAVPGFVDEGASGDWKSAASLSFNMVKGSTYQLVWRVQNYGGAPGTGGNNPMAFLADVSGLFGSAVTSASWEVALDVGGKTPGAWQSATEYALNSGAWLTGASGDSIWYTANSGSIAGISGDAKWIGFDAYPGSPSSDGMFVRLTYTATPLPAAVWLFGGGLISLLGFRRMSKNS